MRKGSTVAGMRLVARRSEEGGENLGRQQSGQREFDGLATAMASGGRISRRLTLLQATTVFPAGHPIPSFSVLFMGGESQPFLRRHDAGPLVSLTLATPVACTGENGDDNYARRQSPIPFESLVMQEPNGRSTETQLFVHGPSD